MGLIRNIWKRLTPTEALEQSNGELETLFFESVYRVAYISGLSSSDHKLPYLLYSGTVKLLIGLLILGEQYFTITETLSMDVLVGSINSTVIQLITLYRYKNMMDNKHLYKKLAVSMESPNFDTSTEKRKNLIRFWANRNEIFLKVLLFLGNCTLAAWYSFPLVDDVEYNHIVGIRFPFKYDTPLRYSLTYILMMVVFTYVSHFVMVTELIMQAHLIHLLCQFTVLSDCFENILVDCRDGFEVSWVVFVVLFLQLFIILFYVVNEVVLSEFWAHNQLEVMLNSLVVCKTSPIACSAELIVLVLAGSGHTMNLRKSLSRPMLGQLISSGILICFIGYQATTTLTESFAKTLMSMLYLGYNLFEFYITCRWCEEITLESQKIGEAAYSSGWESGMATVPGVRSTLMLVIARANKPLIFTAGGMYDLSLSSYSNLVKTSYSALTVLLRFRHE